LLEPRGPSLKYYLMQRTHKIRRVLAGALPVIIGLTFLTGAAPATAKFATFVIDSETGKVRHSVNADQRNYPASLTKLMTLYLLFEAVDNGQVTMDTRLSISRRAARQPASKLGLLPGHSIAVRTAIQALAIKSANDVASVVAEALGQSERRFALLMTAKARKLGMSRTTFRNASGLPHRGQLTTARDLATLSQAIIQRYPHYYHFFSKPSFSFDGHTYRSHNKVMKTFPGADGLKTGYIHASGYNLITSAERSDHRLIGVVMGGNSVRARDRTMKRLLENAFKEHRDEVYAAAPANTKKAPVKPEPAEIAAVKEKAKAGKSASVWGIQVGAFYTRSPALKLAQVISDKYADYLAGGHIVVMPLANRHKRTLYRARILGIGKKNAYRACRALERNRRQCLELKLPDNVEMASR